MKITVYEITMKAFLMRDIPAEDEYAEIARFIDGGLGTEPELLKFHQKNCYKGYAFSLLTPIDPNGVYRKGEIYSFRIRTVDRELAKFFSERLVHHYNEIIKGLTAEIRMIPRRPIEKLYSLTVSLLKLEEGGYWKEQIPMDEFERRLFENLVKKHNHITGNKMNEDFPLYTSIKFLNRGPIAMKYKGIKLLGDKIELEIDPNKAAQELAYMSLGTGILEMNGRGAGYVNYKWV